MSSIRDHRDLEAWRIAMDAVIETYRLTARFPLAETYELQSQMRRAAVSVPSNIAEGQARQLRASLNHLSIALGSLAELATQLDVSVRLAYVSMEAAAHLSSRVESSRRLVHGLRRAKRLRLAGTAAGSAGLLFLAIRILTRVGS
jgi:four helix bundle protein